MSPLGRYLLETGITLLGVLLLAGLVLLAARRLGAPQVGGPLALLGRLPLEPRRSVCLVKVLDTVYVLGVSEAGVSKLGELEPTAAAALTSAPPRRFSDLLGRLAKGRAHPPEGGAPEANG